MQGIFGTARSYSKGYKADDNKYIQLINTKQTVKIIYPFCGGLIKPSVQKDYSQKGE